MTAPPGTPGAALAAADRRRLVAVARAAVEHGLQGGTLIALDTEAYPPALRAPRACFVTLRAAGELRGCVGSLEARRSLAADAAHNAYAAAFGDPRFAPLEQGEYAGLDMSIAVLSAPQALPCSCREELLALLRPGIDGVIVAAGPALRATFLPAVWESLPDPHDFVHHLMAKAGLPAAFWSPQLQFQRYTVENVS